MKLKSVLEASYAMWPGNGSGLFSSSQAPHGANTIMIFQRLWVWQSVLWRQVLWLLYMLAIYL